MNKTRVAGFICISLLLLSLSACSGQSFRYDTYIANVDNSSYRIAFNDDNTFVVTELGAGEDTGTFSVKGDELTWETDVYCDSLNAGKATYTWTFKDDTLELKVKGEDKCPLRLSVLTSGPLHVEK